MLVTKKIEIDMAHRVPNHKSKCKNLHGHRYTIEVGVDDKVVDAQGESDEGMVIDFSDLKKIMMDEIDASFDHNCVFYKGDPIIERLQVLLSGNQDKKPHVVSFIPTAENLAKYWFTIMKMNLVQVGIKIKFVRVWETPTSTATYEEA